MAHNMITWFQEVSLKDISLVGGKNASLGEMIQNLSHQNVSVPQGFALTTHAYTHFLHLNELDKKIYPLLSSLDPKNLAQLTKASANVKNLIRQASFDETTIALIKSYYEQLQKGQSNIRVAVRSSASAEDLPQASFAGQQDTYLHVASFDELLERIKDVYASLFGERAIAYRSHHQFRHEDVHISVGIQEMVHSDSGVSGVMFTLDPESGFSDVIFINAAYGLGEGVVSGAINPDEYVLYKPKAMAGEVVVLSQKLGSKAKKFIYSEAREKSVIEATVSEPEREVFCLNKADLAQLAHAACVIEKHYQRPMDIEWAKDGITGHIYILQARPETVHSNTNHNTSIVYSLEPTDPPIVEGRAVGKRIGQGRARVLKNIHEAHDFKDGEVLVTDMTDPNWEPVMQKASAIVTNRGGRTCHAAIIARELGIAAVVGCHDADQKIQDKSDITVSCAHGDVGQVFLGLLPIKKQEMEITAQKTPVPLMLIAANPTRAFSYHNLPHQGIGLARLEFIIAHSIGIHPNALINFNDMPKDIQKEIHNKTKNFSSPTEFYVEVLAQGIAALASVAKPHPIIVRLSDFKTNEYEELLGGHIFEHKENNPMIGFRGAARYISDSFAEAFKLECQALKRARELYGFSNIEVMVPFVRTLNEAQKVIEALANNGLRRGENGLKIIMMCEIPSNVILADQFLDYFDGFSIGSNDLTQLTLGIDRDSHVVASQFSESDPALKKMLSMAIKTCKSRNKYVGICGQGPSDDSNLARWLIGEGIDSISLTPDTIADVAKSLNLA